MEEDLKILQVEYLGNHSLDHTQIFNLSKDDQTVYYKPYNEDDLQRKMILKY